MSSWKGYYDKTEKVQNNPSLRFACERMGPNLPKTAIDCGCGAGRNSEYLLSQGFKVSAFDMDTDAVKRCNDKFNSENFDASQASFTSFTYPSSALVVASYSLFFCDPDEYPTAWSMIVDSLLPGGIFCGTFLGPEDTWAQPDFVFSNAPFQKISAHTDSELEKLLKGFEILEKDIKNFDGQTATGTKKHWHTIEIVAKLN